MRRFGAPVLQLRHLVPQGPGNAPQVAAGPINPVAAGTLKEPAVVQKDVGCYFCLAHKCRIGFLCLKVLEVEDVLEAVQELKP